MAVQQFKEKNMELVEGLKSLGWDYPEDEDDALVAMHLFEEDPDFVACVRLSKEVQQQKASGWTQGPAQLWELESVRPGLGGGPPKWQKAREELVAQCFRKAVDANYLEYVKRRYEQNQFSSVSAKYMTIGDITIQNYFVRELKEESDPDLPCAGVGRQNLTYAVWSQTLQGRKIQGYRLKINGERFVADRRRHKLVGYREFDLPKGFIPEVVEEYAGKFYVVHPATSVKMIYEMSGTSYEFFPHPWLSAAQLLATPNIYSHQYDGIMVSVDGVEYRSKWQPTVEVEMDGDVWEVSLGTDHNLVPVRARHGKKAASQTSRSVIGRLQSCMPASSIVPFIQKLSSDPTHVLHESLLAQKIYQRNESAKVVYVSPGSVNYLHMIRLPGKRLDFIGGVVEEGELPIDALVREVFEETRYSPDPMDFIYIGVSKEVTDTTVWSSHMYVAVAPTAISRHKYVESYPVTQGKFTLFKNSDAGRPRQVWVARHLDMLSDIFHSTEQLDMCLFMFQKIQSCKQVTPSKGVLEIAGPHYRQWIESQLKNEIFASTVAQGLIWVPLDCLLSEEVKKWIRSPRMTSSTASTSTSLLPKVETIAGVPVSDVGFPDTVEDSIILLSHIFAGLSCLPAQDYYKKTHQLGGPPGRNLAMRWIEKLSQQGIVEILPQIDGTGRRFKLTQKAGAMAEKNAINRRSVTVWKQQLFQAKLNVSE